MRVDARFVRRGLDEAAKWTHARMLNIARRHLNQEQKRALIADELRDNAKRSNRQIGEALGVSHPTVSGVRAEMEATGKIYQLASTIGADVRDKAESNGEIPQCSERQTSDGRRFPARKPNRPIRYTLIDETREGVKALKARVKEVRAGALTI